LDKAIIRRAAARRQDYGSMTEQIPDRPLKCHGSNVNMTGRWAVMAIMGGTDGLTLAGLHR
jgi:hypothetical protein